MLDFSLALPRGLDRLLSINLIKGFRTKMSSDSPQFVVENSQLVPTSTHLANSAPIVESHMFLIKQSLEVFAKDNPDQEVFDASQGDGGASLNGIRPHVFELATRMQINHGNSYDKPWGCPEFRQVMYEDYWHGDPSSGFEPENILAAVGGRDALVKAYGAMMASIGCMGASIIVSHVPWTSYNWGPYGIGLNVLRAPGSEDNAWEMTPETITESIKYSQSCSRPVAGVIITSPDNPTGRTLTPERQVELGKTVVNIPGEQFVLYDWMYHWLSDKPPMDINWFLSQFTAKERERIIILDGITKSLGASNVRNAHLVAHKNVIQHIQSQASHTTIPSYYSQAVAMAAVKTGFREASDVISACAASRKIVRDFVDTHNIHAILGDGYYAFINVRPWLNESGMVDSVALRYFLAEEHGLAVVPGAFFSEAGTDWIRFSYALPPKKTAGALQRLLEGLDAL